MSSKAGQDPRLSKYQDSDVLADQLIISLKVILLSSKAIKDNEKMIETCKQSLSFILGKEALAA